MKTIVFDFGNVIAFFDHGRAVEKLARFTDMPAAELRRTLYDNPIEDRYERGQLSTAEYVRQATENGRLTCSQADFLAAFVDIVWPNPEVIGLIPLLKPRYRLVLASNTNDAHFTKFTHQFADVLAEFDHLCTSHRCGFRKPEAGFFAHCQHHAAAAPADCLFVDDLPANVAAARSHGWQGIDYPRPGTLQADLEAAGVQFG